jgi:phospholipid/cholesterol/gamma-HCH transport system substrate-binding protein
VRNSVSEHSKTEITVGAFVLAGGVALAYLSLALGAIEIGPTHYSLFARFAAVGDLKRGAPVKVAGVKIGAVQDISLENYAAEVRLEIDRDIKLPSDTIGSIRVLGLLGDSYISLSPGGSEKDLSAGDHLTHTEPAIELIDLLAKFILGSSKESPGL